MKYDQIVLHKKPALELRTWKCFVMVINKQLNGSTLMVGQHTPDTPERIIQVHAASYVEMIVCKQLPQ